MIARSGSAAVRQDASKAACADGHKLRGITLIEWLVVIVIIAMLLGLLIPATQRTGGTNRRVECANRQRNLALAMLHHESNKMYFPGCMNQVGALPDPDATPVITSYVVPLLPYLGRSDLWRSWTEANPTFATPFIGMLVCPSDLSDTTNASLAYVVNGGVEPSSSQSGGSGPGGAWTIEQKMASGICFDLSPSSNELIRMSAGYVARRDGLSHTLLVTENIQADYWSADRWANASQAMFKAKTTFLWKNEVNPSGSWRINQSKASPPSNSVAFARPSSNHPGGVNVQFADGHYRFIDEKIDYIVYRQLMSPNNDGLPGTGAPASATSAKVTVTHDELEF